jgi:NADH dehydrogenase FAD-containing subunit
MNDTERFVTVGGGFAGVTLAQRLERLPPPRMEVIVTVGSNELGFLP